jgi:hypothetical protein
MCNNKKKRITIIERKNLEIKTPILQTGLKD